LGVKTRKRAVLCLVLLVLSLSLLNPVVSATTGWTKTYLGKTNMLTAMIQTNDGGYALAGYVETPFSDTGNEHPWFAKVDSSGDLQWNQTYLGAMPHVHAIVQAADGGYALAGDAIVQFQGTSIWLAKTDSHGNLLWNQTYGQGTSYSIVQTTDGGYALAGFQQLHNSFVLVKTDPDGAMLWKKDFGGTENLSSQFVANMVCCLIQTSDNGYLLAGQSAPADGSLVSLFWIGKVDSIGNMQWNQTCGVGMAHSVVQTSDGGYAAAGATSSGAGCGCSTLVKIDSFGNLLWRQTR
jgi:hypothetical protein